MEPLLKKRLEAWAASANGPWKVEPATRGNYRLLYDGDRKVLIAHDTRQGVTGFVDCARSSDMPELSRYGACPSGCNETKRGANFIFSDFEAFLRWCELTVPARSASLSKLDRTRTGPKH